MKSDIIEANINIEICVIILYYIKMLVYETQAYIKITYFRDVEAKHDLIIFDTRKNIRQSPKYIHIYNMTQT